MQYSRRSIQKNLSKESYNETNTNKENTYVNFDANFTKQNNSINDQNEIKALTVRSIVDFNKSNDVAPGSGKLAVDYKQIVRQTDVGLNNKLKEVHLSSLKAKDYAIYKKSLADCLAISELVKLKCYKTIYKHVVNQTQLCNCLTVTLLTEVDHVKSGSIIACYNEDISDGFCLITAGLKFTSTESRKVRLYNYIINEINIPGYKYIIDSIHQVVCES